MKNNVCVNLKSYSKSEYYERKNHNLNRKNYNKNISYLLPRDKILEKNEHFSFNDFEELEEKRLKILKESNRKDFQKCHLVEFVVSLSWDQVENYIKNGENIDDGFLNFSKKIKEEFGFEIVNVDIHKDEGYINENNETIYNYHAHILTNNFNFDKNKVILSNLEKKDFRKLQDLAQNSFQELNLNFERGTSKFKTKKEHKDRNNYIKIKQTKEIRQKFYELDQQQKKLKETYTLLNKQKNEMKTLRSNFEKETLEFQKLSNKIFELAKLEQDKRRQYRELEEKIKLEKEIFYKEKNSTQNKIKEIFRENTFIQKNILGNEYIKIENYEKLYEEIVNEINKPYQYQIDENDYLKKELEKLKLNENELKKWIDKSVMALEIEQKKAKEYLKKIRKLENRTTLMVEFFKFKGFKLSDFREFEQNKKDLDEKVTSLLTRF
ncbi:hypothetical protein HUX57_01425 [Arcobacter butzleri]|uniref:hypothetical protein n=1 Tax=Aliarcobacter butzleri TaxID=28197 RepID=UPI0015870D95|nr:hypothetical protein [Aliarcobacter butzleri]NUW25336.1 hypothetical protein [Aliarcobacter butzleri]